MNKIVYFRKCTLSDKELIAKVDKKTDELFRNETDRERVLTRHIPAQVNEDYDLLVGELIIRFNELVDNNSRAQHDENSDT
jgi:hypothetical protein